MLREPRQAGQLYGLAADIAERFSRLLETLLREQAIATDDLAAVGVKMPSGWVLPVAIVTERIELQDVRVPLFGKLPLERFHAVLHLVAQVAVRHTLVEPAGLVEVVHLWALAGEVMHAGLGLGCC